MSGEHAISSQELACIYSAAILADDDIPVTADKMVTLIRTAGVVVEPVWPALYAKALQTIDIKQFVTRVGAGSMVGGAGGAVGAGGAPGADAKQDAKEQAPAAAAVEEEDSDDEDMGLSLFD